MGVSGSGKTTLGKLLAERGGGVFADADDLHPPENIAKMCRGEALDDADRAPWLESLAARLRAHPAEGPPLFLACSALKDAYRQTLRAAAPGRVAFFFLNAAPELIHARLEARQARGGHFMPSALLASQLATLEAPAEAVTLDASLPSAQLATAILRELGIAEGLAS